VTSLRGRAQANAPTVLYWLRRVLDDGGRRDQRVLGALGSVACNAPIGNESVPIQLAQCRFPGLAIFIAKIYIFFKYRPRHGSNFIKQHSESVMV